MLRYIVGRLMQSLVVVFGVVTHVFVLEHLLPGDQGHIMLGPRAAPAQWAVYDHENGRDSPSSCSTWTFSGTSCAAGSP